MNDITYLYGWPKTDPRRRLKPVELASLTRAEQSNNGLIGVKAILARDGWHGIFARNAQLPYDQYRHDAP